ncbi:hypothetical protein C1H46_039124 [Malus baccata]|uniref:Uncharacterized protein n=1 Tax=Malus baccata TaxID=106549 RepID=A0A540KMB6_MALBA|nr:hypothetical protein C1H46_039124 [Malus baccata]
MGFKLAYRMHMSEFKNENSSQQTACAMLEIRTRQRLQFQLLTCNNDLASRTVLKDVVSPVLTTNPIRRCASPRYSLACTLPALHPQCAYDIGHQCAGARACVAGDREVRDEMAEAAEVAGVKSVWGDG